jgi:hypothetical protein
VRYACGLGAPDDQRTLLERRDAIRRQARVHLERAHDGGRLRQRGRIRCGWWRTRDDEREESGARS